MDTSNQNDIQESCSFSIRRMSGPEKFQYHREPKLRLDSAKRPNSFDIQTEKRVDRLGQYRATYGSLMPMSRNSSEYKSKNLGESSVK